MKLALLFIFSCSAFFTPVSTGKILFLFPIATKSHKNVFDPLINALADKGHELNVITPVKTKNVHVNVKEIVPIPLSSFLQQMDDPFEMRRVGKLKALLGFDMEKIVQLCDNAFKDPEFLEFINQDYDLVIMNGFINNCFDGVLYKIRAPHILITTVAAPSLITEYTGNHLPSSFVPFVFFDFTDDMSFTERVMNSAMNLLMKIVITYFYNPKYEAVYRKHLGENTPGSFEIHRNVSMIFMNSHFSLTYPRPNLPDNVEVGGMHCRPSKPLPKDLDDFLTGAEHGFIYFSLGSIVQANQMPDEYRRVFVNVFGKLKQRVIWKWETEEMVDLPKNVLLRKWLPQQDILGHPNIRVFMTHGGLLSTQEAVYHGVPLLGIPVFGDQDMNMNQAEKQGYAITLEVLNMTESLLEEKLFKLLNEPHYKARAKELSSVFRDQMETPVERAVYWSEYIMRHKGAPHLRSAARDLNYFQVHSYDVVGFVFAILLLILCLIKFTCSRLLRLCSKGKSSENKKLKVKKNK